MSPLPVMMIQAVLTFVITGLIGWWYVAPALAARPLKKQLEPLLLVHSFRFVPLALFLPGQVAPEFPAGLRSLIAYGDFVSGLLALGAVLVWRYREAAGRLTIWIFRIVGTADMVTVLIGAMSARIYDLPLGFLYYVPALYVPVLAVFQIMILACLAKGKQLQ